MIAVLVTAGILFGTGTGILEVSNQQLLLLGLGTTSAVGAHAVCQWWGARSSGLTMIPGAGWRSPEVRQVLHRIVPTLGFTGLAALQLFAVMVVAARFRAPRGLPARPQLLLPPDGRGDLADRTRALPLSSPPGGGSTSFANEACGASSLPRSSPYRSLPYMQGWPLRWQRRWPSASSAAADGNSRHSRWPASALVWSGRPGSSLGPTPSMPGRTCGRRYARWPSASASP